MRTYHGFARRHTKNSLDNGKSSSHLSGSDLAACDSARADHPYRPESSIHNTSYASSVDAGNDDDDDGNFSEDESDDSIEVGNEAGDLRDGSKAVPSDEDFRYSCTRNESNSKLRSTCKPYVDSFNSKGSRPDDDSDNEEGRWAQQTNRPASYHRDGSRRNVNTNKHGHKTSGVSTAQGKQGSSRMRGDEEMKRSDLGVSEFDGCLNNSVPKRAHGKYRNSAARANAPFESRQTREYKIGEPVSGSSPANAQKVIDVHIVVSQRQNATPVERSGSIRDIDEDRETSMRKIRGEFPKEEDSGDFLDDDALDSDRIPSADIFKVLDNLNLSTSAMKPPTPGDDRVRGRRVQSAGYTRRKPPVSRGEKPMTKRGKRSRPASAKQGGRQKMEKSDWVNSSGVNTVSSTFGRTEGLMRHSREKIPGYFTEQYKKILDEKNASNEQTDKVKPEAVSSSSLALAPKESAENSATLNDGEKHDHTRQTSLSSDCQKDETSLRTSNSEPSGPRKVESLRDKREKYLKQEITSQSSLSGVFVTSDDKSKLRSVNNADDSSSGVETMSCVTDTSSFERFVGASDRINSNGSQSCRVGETFDSGSVEEVNNGDDDVYCDEIDDDDDSGDGCIDDFDYDVSSLEVVAKPKPLSESRLV